MHKIKNLFLKMDKTKRRTILFVLLSLIIVVSLSFYYQTDTKEVKQDTTKEVLKNTTENKETTEETVEEKEVVEKQKTTTKEETTQETKTTTTTKKKTTSKSTKKSTSNKQTNNEVKDETIEETYTISVSIIGYQNEVILNTSLTLNKETSYTAYDALKLACDNNGIEIKKSGSGKTVYVKSINGLKEKQHGGTSGWMYSVNGDTPNIGAGSYTLNENDVMEWYYVWDD